ncbi:MAG: ABC transporter substrate-binding protein, partial [Odoribacter sp.]|nr:ABC transporter substrate-binding protein [Odoribacter sp.]
MVIILLLAACRQKDSSVSQGQEGENFRVEYATGFSVSCAADYTKVEVRDPWDTTKVLQRYVLVSAEKELPLALPQGILVRTPLKRVVAATSV